MILTAILIFILTVQSSFLTALTISTITRLIVYATTCLALPVFRRKKDAPEAQFKSPFGIAAAVLSLLLTIWLLTRVDYSKEGLAIIVLAVIGLAVYFIYNLFGKEEAESNLPQDK